MLAMLTECFLNGDVLVMSQGHVTEMTGLHDFGQVSTGRRGRARTRGGRAGARKDARKDRPPPAHPPAHTRARTGLDQRPVLLACVQLGPVGTAGGAVSCPGCTWLWQVRASGVRQAEV